jgi:Predicted transcriptional regulators
MEMNIGEKIKSLRQIRGLTQGQLSIKSGLPRTTIASIENKISARPSAAVLVKLATALNVDVSELYEAAGIYATESGKRHIETPDEILERLRLASPIAVPVYTDFVIHAGDNVEAPIEYIYLARPKATGKNIEAYLIKGQCMEPDIRDGDIAIVDRDTVPEKGNIILCLINNEIVIGRYLMDKEGKPYIQNGHGKHDLKECQATAVVTEISRKMR